jgi:hypothetical protein
MTESHTITLTAWGETHTLTPQVSRYSMKDRLAISFYDEEGPYASLTVNLPNEHLNEDEVFVKDWSECEGLAQACIEAGWLLPTGREVSSGFVFPKVMRLAGPLLEMTKE